MIDKGHPLKKRQPSCLALRDEKELPVGRSGNVTRAFVEKKRHLVGGLGNEERIAFGRSGNRDRQQGTPNDLGVHSVVLDM